MGYGLETYIPVSMADAIRKLGIQHTPIVQNALREAIAAKKAHIAWAEAGCPKSTSEPEPVTPKIRSLVGNYVGSNAETLEENALKTAREFFGPDVVLTVVPGYQVTQNLLNSRDTRYTAAIRVEAKNKLGELRELLSITHDEGTMSFVTRVIQPFKAKTVAEGVEQAIEEVREGFGREAVLQSRLEPGSVSMIDGMWLGSVEIKVYLT